MSRPEFGRGAKRVFASDSDLRYLHPTRGFPHMCIPARLR